MSALSKLDPSSYPVYPGITLKGGNYVEIKTNEEDINLALDGEDLEKAKDAIYNCYGVWNLEAQKKLLLLVEKIVKLNVYELSPEHEKLNYTLGAAYSFGCHIYTAACNAKYSELETMGVAIKALNLVAGAYEKKNDYCKAVHCLSRLDGYTAKGYLDPVLRSWKKYIQNECPQDQKERQEYLYDIRERQVSSDYINSPEVRRREQKLNSPSSQLRRMGL